MSQAAQEPGADATGRWRRLHKWRVPAEVPRYYFHLFNDETTWDEEGRELPSDAVALEEAAKDARTMAAESVRNGQLILDHRVVVCGANNQSIGTVHFRDVVTIKELP